MKNDSKSFALTIRSNPFMAALIAALVASLIAMAVSFYLLQRDAGKDQAQLQLTAELRASSYRLTALSRESTSGDEKAFSELSKVVAEMDGKWQELRSQDDSNRTMMAAEYAAFDSVWQRVKSNSRTIINNKDTIIFLNDVANTLNQSLPELQAEHNNIVEILLESNAPADQVAVAQMQSWRAERIGRNVDKMLRGGSDAMESADQFNLDANLFGKVLTGMSDGDVAMSISKVTDTDAIDSLVEIKELFDFVSSSVKEIFEASPSLFKARQAADALLDDSPVLLETLSDLTDGISSSSEQRQPNNTTIAIIALIGVVLLIVIGAQLLSSSRKRLEESAAANERNQQAILRLLDELADLADGDLTTSATVTEDFTGAIADSVNYAIDQLRILVSRINETSTSVSSAAQGTQQTALHLAEASEHQAQEIAGASAAVNEMAVTIDQVSVNAAESAGVAERSVTIANNGAKVVQNTITGMDTIREQIQDTSKRIKRLGESSQEIGDIVSLINDIADQTNILALNAAIQASMAGDAGRGFAVVADEVQRLAERSAAATKQIEGLVKAIQNDTNEAVMSMEQTTTEVVKGARLAQDAGVALEEIEGVSSSLAELIQSISNAARQQASSAGHISNTMNVIQEITSQTSSGTSATAQSIGNLADMATDLQDSVAGFTLPEGMRMASANEDDVVFDGGDDQDVEINLDDVDGLDASYDSDEEVLEVAGNQ
ncbi:methyl-accepting chemotaxis protein [Pseudoteredinibacter isoporae]|uniref:Twitching motility protein PilJ n=1 Tax=Pseudoteredinibacter isoporae TaxID=570281 RepID=A0A7X0JPG9_9GAMM|nr:methyl-accepting chemotaxis protein [Pseudoteredinibacter isoporae]MBB6519890.1 twitching motility protein PilJ [Pseudoteredinibacter isoporae]NHO85468.1 chemotaxis protein [Pseudoteredinibacter isoporae]NIB26080.1 chemotaxis protein [Pseudoteredinibacter isoporae]